MTKNKMKHYKRFLFLLAMLSAATISMAQTIIVKDSITNESIPFVSVYFGNDTGGYTDENGKKTKQNRYGCLISATRQRASLR